MRLVSLVCSNTEMVAALGCADQLVGVDNHSDWPPDVVSGLPRVGPDLQIDIAKVAALRPDLVLASLTVPGHEHVVSGLREAGLPHVVFDPTSLRDVYANIEQLGRRLDVPQRATELAGRMQDELEGGDASRGRGRASILVEWWPKPVIVPGKRSWVTQLLDAVGGVNPLASEDVKSRPITDEDALALDPDAVVIAWCGVPPGKYRPDVVFRRERWSGIEALRRRRVYCVPEAYLGRPGPRLLEGAKALRRIVAECTPG